MKTTIAILEVSKNKEFIQNNGYIADLIPNDEIDQKWMFSIDTIEEIANDSETSKENRETAQNIIKEYGAAEWYLFQ